MPSGKTDPNTTPEETQAAVSEKVKRKGRKAIEKKAVALKRLKVEYVGVDSIKPNKYNPNRQNEHDFELLLKSMQEDGFTQPIVCQKNRTIVDGEHRWRAAKTLGYDEIPVVFVDMTDEQMKISTLRHNRARGSEDIELTAALMKDLQELGALDWAQDSLMMDDVEMNSLLEEIPVSEALAGDEFEESWEPDQVGPEEAAGTGVEARTVRDGAGTEVANASTGDALSAIRNREKKIQEAKNEEERAAIRRDTDIFRLRLTFTGDEATLVKKALGDKPAEALLTLCRDSLSA